MLLITLSACLSLFYLWVAVFPACSFLVLSHNYRQALVGNVANG